MSLAVFKVNKVDSRWSARFVVVLTLSLPSCVHRCAFKSRTFINSLCRTSG